MANERMRELWTKFGGPAWIANRRIFASAYAPFVDALLEALGPVEGLTVLDVGCGGGRLSRAIVDRGGVAVGVDISESMIAAAREHVPQATFVVADAQVAALGEHAVGGFDVVTSQFGVMFFEHPVTAFGNLAGATKPGGRLTFQCWRSLDENPNFSNGIRLLAERLPEQPPPTAAGVPGPTMFADPTYTTSVLSDAGWTAIEIVPFDAMCSFGLDGSDGVEERMALIRSNPTGRTAFEQLPSLLGEAEWQALLGEVGAEVEATKVNGVVALPGATWIVRADKPG